MSGEREERDYLKRLPKADGATVRRLREEHDRRQLLPKKGFLRFRKPWQAICGLPVASHCDFSGDSVLIGRPEEIDAEQRHTLHRALRAFMPWRKGPFSLFGIEIDAEWQSFRKWQRLLPALPELAGRVVADIGCNNGYYMFKMLPHRPALVVGFEPMLQHLYCFKALRHLAGCRELEIEPLGVEQITLYPQSFDVIFLMGVIYHRPSPLTVLREVFAALKPGGTLILESLAIPGEDPVALCPAATYAKAPGVYFIPTVACLLNWLQRAKFKQVELVSNQAMDPTEQRRTPWMTFESYADFIDPLNPARTIEGYPAPLRVILKAS
ncbi:MAG TPA: tRNA 5-methoxyuridine(34)/uridine 5-oxyacetic acid(34) synthase CmoB [Desulfurivibrio alkaliphilus]|uniref:tRNA 5-methoxyuridine(34)/uridine 5-oxyacetic acid(34) synthase CmoB n=1 Tax=Desulfurivibrio alkaliphilus TaxID=427923 RepID=A0A7C2TGC2_9BACT|nr:tRNA 5-methoxyuridine(34)/uridine 5-oxyacetic acid(34) synthase CmoB [Desulfurivibrio alkaliphilus]